MSKVYSIFDEAALGPSLEIDQGGVVLRTTASALDINRTARGSVGLRTLTRFVEFIVYGEGALTDKVSVGVCSTSASLSNYVGGQTSSIGYRVGEGQIRRNDSTLASVETGVDGSVIGVLVAFGSTFVDVTFFHNGVFQYTAQLDGGSPLDELADTDLFWAVSLGSVDGDDIRVFVNSGLSVYEYPVSSSNYEWAGQVVSAGAVRIADEGFLTHPTDSEPNTRYHGIIADADLIIDRGVTFWPWGDRGASRGSVAVINAVDADELLDPLLYGSFRDQPVTLYRAAAGGSVASADALGTFYLERVEVSSELDRRITVRDALSLLETPLLRRNIRPDAVSENAFAPYPVMWGAVFSVNPPIIDDIEYIYAIDSRGISNLGKVRDKGDPLETTASPATYTIIDSGTKLSLRFPPAGVVTLDAEYTGDSTVVDDGEASPPPDVLAGIGNPFSGTEGVVPTGWEHTFDTAQIGLPVLGAGGQVVFPHYQNSSLACYMRAIGVTLRDGIPYKIRIRVESMLPYEVYGGGHGIFLSRVAYQYASFWNTLAPSLLPGAPSYPQDFEINYTPIGDHGLFLGYHSNSGFVFTPGDPGAYVSLLTVQEVPQVDPDADDATVENSLRAMPLALGIKEAIEVRGLKPSTIWTQATAAAIDTASGYSGIGFYSAEQVTIRYAIDAMLDSYTASIFVARDGKLKVVRLVAPETVTSIADVRDFITPPLPEWDEARGLTRLMGVRRNEYVMDDSDFVTDDVDVTLSLRRRLSKRHRILASTGAPLAPGYEHAYTAPPLDGRLVNREDGFTEISRVNVMYGSSRSFYTARISRRTDFDVGDVVTVYYNRFGLANGRKLFVARIRENGKSDVMEVTFWGLSPTA